jgi:hypothetical protein
MEQVRNRRLDHVCESLLEVRTRINADRGEEAGLEKTGLDEMHRTGGTVYKHAGIELVLVPGAEKLRVRLTKETGDAQVGGEGENPLGEDNDALGEMPD